jgi:Domain of unknown function (DUF4062)
VRCRARWANDEEAIQQLDSHARRFSIAYCSAMINRNERLVIDVAGIAARPDDDRLRSWLSVQRVFISSPMDDTRDDRASVAAAIEALGATPIWFEEFGGRDADPTAAYTDEVDRSSIYLALLRERYGKMLPSGYSATHVEYLQARDRGLRISIWVADDAADRDGHLVRFIDDVRVFHVTGRFRSTGELAERVTRRLQEIAAEELSPWVKLGGLVFRADRITDSGATVVVESHPGTEVVAALERRRDQQFGDRSVRFAYGNRVVVGQLSSVSRTTEAAGRSSLTLTLDRCEPVRRNDMSMSINGISADDLVERGLRSQLFREALPDALRGMESMADSGVDADALQVARQLPEEILRPILRLLLADGMIGSGKAESISRLDVGTRQSGGRLLAIEWLAARTYADAEPASHRVEGRWNE